jgi:transcriptional regulator with XRE-family HTH domain
VVTTITRGERLRLLRFEHGNPTQEDVEKASGVDASHLSQAENDKKGVSLETLTKLALYYDESIDWICGLTDQRRSGIMRSQSSGEAILREVRVRLADGTERTIEVRISGGLTKDSTAEEWADHLARIIRHDGAMGPAMREAFQKMGEAIVADIKNREAERPADTLKAAEDKAPYGG